MTLAGKAYFDAVSKVGENAMASLVSRELGEFFIAKKLRETIWEAVNQHSSQ